MLLQEKDVIPIDLAGKVCIVTGATGELGRTIARTLGTAGANVAIHYLRNRDKAESLKTEVIAMGRRAITVQADVAKLDAVMAMRDEIQTSLGNPHIVVANAVSQYKWTSILEQPLEDFEDQFRSCVAHLVNLAKAFAPDMVAKRYGRIVAINTECAMQCHHGQGAYASAKRGMDGIVRVLSRELGEHQITVNQVAPGWMISDRQRGTAEEVQPAYEKSVSLKRRGYDQDIANAVAFLSSDLAKFITGTYLPVCGGNVMPGI